MWLSSVRPKLYLVDMCRRWIQLWKHKLKGRVLFLLEKIPPEENLFARVGVIDRLGGFISRANGVTGSRLYWAIVSMILCYCTHNTVLELMGSTTVGCEIPHPGHLGWVHAIYYSSRNWGKIVVVDARFAQTETWSFASLSFLSQNLCPISKPKITTQSRPRRRR